MDEMKLIRVFLRVVDSGSISAASRQLNASVTSVARQISQLETMMGVRLLARTTRRQSLTEVGRHYYSKLLSVVREFDDIKREVLSYQETAKGRLRVHLRTTVGTQVIVPALPRFFAEYPDVTLDVTLTDERADLVALGVDVAVWLGKLDDSTFIARRLSPSRRVLCASPAYLARHGHPHNPADLAKHNCLVYRAKHYDNRWRFVKDGERIEVPVSGNLETDSGAVLFTSALNGLGLILVQESMAREALARGEIISLLEGYEVSPTEFDTALYVVHPGGHHVSPKTRAFIDFLVALFRKRH